MDSIKKLTALFAKFPTIGSRTAGRFVSYLINQPKEATDELILAIQELKTNIKLCAFCFNPFEPFTAPPDNGADIFCPICQNKTRNRQLLCVIEKEADLASIENTKRYNGLYFILGGTITYKNIGGSNLRIKPFQERIIKNNFTEIIIATNSTPEGKATSLLVERALKELAQFPSSPTEALAKGGFKITHLAKGLPVGGELEYADEETLESAFEGRK